MNWKEIKPNKSQKRVIRWVNEVQAHCCNVVMEPLEDGIRGVRATCSHASNKEGKCNIKFCPKVTNSSTTKSVK